MKRSKRSTSRRASTGREPTHPGEILLQKFLEPRGLNQREFAEYVGMSVPWVNALVRGRRNVTVETALRLSQAFGTTIDFWLDLQQAWDIQRFLQSAKGRQIQRIRPIKRGRA